MNFAGSLFGGFAVASALSRSILQDITGGSTQVSKQAIDLAKNSLYPVLMLLLSLVVGWFGVFTASFHRYLVLGDTV